MSAVALLHPRENQIRIQDARDKLRYYAEREGEQILHMTSEQALALSASLKLVVRKGTSPVETLEYSCRAVHYECIARYLAVLGC
jgi:hypothetical protein